MMGALCIRLSFALLFFFLSLINLQEIMKWSSLCLVSGRLHFCEDDEVENIFQYGLGGGQFFYWSFVNSNEEHRWRSSSHSHYSNSYRTSYNYRYQSEEEYDSSSASELASHRLALGLKSYGPLKLEDVKSAWVLCLLFSFSCFYIYIYISFLVRVLWKL